MKHSLGCLGILASALASPASAQTSHSNTHQHHHQPPAAAAAQAKPPQKATPPGKPAAKPGGYQSAFSDYRPFTADEPLKDWRTSNDDVRDAGGHIGILKAQERGSKR